MSLKVVFLSSDEEDEISGDIPWKRQPRVGDSSSQPRVGDSSSLSISSKGQMAGIDGLVSLKKFEASSGAGANVVESSLKEDSNHPSAKKRVFERLRVELDGSVAKKRRVDFKAPSLPPLHLPSPLASSSSDSQPRSSRWSESAVDTLDKNQRKRQRKKRRKRASLSVMNTLPTGSVAAQEQQQLGGSSSSSTGGFGGRCSLAFYGTPSAAAALNISPAEFFLPPFASQELPRDAIADESLVVDAVDKGWEAEDAVDKGLDAEDAVDKGLDAEDGGLDVDDEVVFIRACTITRVCTGEVVLDDDGDDAGDCHGNNAGGNDNEQINEQGGSGNGSNDNIGNNDDDKNNNNDEDNNNNGVKMIASPATEEVMIEEYIFEEYRTVYFEVSPTSEKVIEDDDFWMAFSQFGTVEKLRLEADNKGMIVFESVLVRHTIMPARVKYGCLLNATSHRPPPGGWEVAMVFIPPPTAHLGDSDT